MLSPRTEFLNGLKAELPILLGVLPFGMIYGVLALQAGLSPALALAMSSIVFAGSSQFIGTQLIAQGAGGFVIIATTFVVNLRPAADYVVHFIFSMRTLGIDATDRQTIHAHAQRGRPQKFQIRLPRSTLLLN